MTVSNHETSFNILTEQMLQQVSHIWNSVEVFNAYVGLGGNHSRKSLITEYNLTLVKIWW